MAVRLVKIVNPNGRTGWVPETHPRLVDGSLRKAPSEGRITERAAAPDEPVRPAEPTADVAAPQPAGNASTQAWRDYAVAQGMTKTRAESMTRTQLRKQLAD